MASGFKNRNRMVVATRAEPGKLSPEIWPGGFDDAAGDRTASSEPPHAASATVPAETAAAPRNRRRVNGTSSFTTDSCAREDAADTELNM
jgi:hypothetical protein